MRDHDVIVIGAGLCGAAIAWGLARSSLNTVVLDGADPVPQG
ncbi:FAD-dependent oxidoreductase [Pseudomonas sp. MM213]|nr:FAD-dependent oxidoreductase [Pseudomonas sp. MM213]